VPAWRQAHKFWVSNAIFCKFQHGFVATHKKPSDQYISFWQKEDLKAVVNHLRKDGNASLIGLWGRSMGAVTRYIPYV
jgi:hypothetical protein